MSPLLFFFFSSRRRHTRYIGDWSSDVCSSDLSVQTLDDRSTNCCARFDSGDPEGMPYDLMLLSVNWTDRSEERRVGKEGRSRWAGADGAENRRRCGVERKRWGRSGGAVATQIR